LGELIDYLSGRPVEDTYDERYHQKIARLLVEGKGYPRAFIRSHCPLHLQVEGRSAVVPIDFLVGSPGRPLMIVKYGPGSLTTRHRSVMAAALLIAPYCVPYCVVTNGEDAEVLESRTGRIVASGLGGIPTRDEIESMTAEWVPATVSARQREMGMRIVFAFEVDDKCPCDDSVCELESPGAGGRFMEAEFRSVDDEGLLSQANPRSTIEKA